MYQTYLPDFWKGAPLALSRLISEVENHPGECLPLLKLLHDKAGKAHVIGITGPPGAGKSTLVSALIREFRSAGEQVAIIAVDPSSPFSGGAILGDRVRMYAHYGDPNVFIRSLSTRGALGGLSRATRSVIALFEAFGFDRIIVETVGVGQSEIEILEVADTTVVVLVPEAGDSIQVQKAGLCEVADIFAVNKADRPGANRMVNHLEESISFSTAKAWKVPVLLTKAREEDRFEGITALLTAIDDHRRFLREDERAHAFLKEDRFRQWKKFALEECERRFDEIFLQKPALLTYRPRVEAGSENPYLLLEEFLTTIEEKLV